MREPRLGSLIAALPPSDKAAGRDDRSRDQSRSSETSQFIRDSPPTHYRECRYAASVLDVTASEPLSWSSASMSHSCLIVIPADLSRAF